MIQIINQFKMLFLQIFCQTYMPCRHQSIKYCDGNYVSCNRSWLGFEVSLFLRMFICNTLLRLFTTSRIIWAAINVVPFCFHGQTWGRFTSTKVSLRVATIQALVQRCSLMKYGTSIGRSSVQINVLNIFRKFLEKQWQSSYSA